MLLLFDEKSGFIFFDDLACFLWATLYFCLHVLVNAIQKVRR